MKENKFRGWKDVFSFTFFQSVKTRGFQTVTLIMALLLAAGIALVVVITAKPEDKEKLSTIQDVYVNDIYDTDYAQWMQMLGLTAFEEVSFKPVKGRVEAIQTAERADRLSYVIVEISRQEDSFLIEAVIPENSTVKNSEAAALTDAMSNCLEMDKLFSLGLSTGQLVGITTPIVTDYSKIGEAGSFGVMIVRMIVPMVFGLVLYMMLILYGQNVSREVSIEKTSKLTETLLTSVQPNALILGKVLAVSAAAILQFFLWVFSAVAGLLIGDAIASSMYPEYENVVFDILQFIRDNIGDTAFSPGAVIIAVLTFVIGFLFFNVLAGIAGSLVSKPDDAAQIQSIFQFPIIISFLVSYFSTMLEKEGLLTACRFIPFTIPFCIPTDILTGAIGIVQGIISLAILIVFSLLLVIISGKLYEGLILYSGQKLNLKTVLNVITAKK